MVAKEKKKKSVKLVAPQTIRVTRRDNGEPIVLTRKLKNGGTIDTRIHQAAVTRNVPVEIINHLKSLGVEVEIL